MEHLVSVIQLAGDVRRSKQAIFNTLRKMGIATQLFPAITVAGRVQAVAGVLPSDASRVREHYRSARPA